MNKNTNEYYFSRRGFAPARTLGPQRTALEYSVAIREFVFGRAKLLLSQATRTDSLSAFVAARFRLGRSLALPFSDGLAVFSTQYSVPRMSYNARRTKACRPQACPARDIEGHFKVVWDIGSAEMNGKTPHHFAQVHQCDAFEPRMRGFCGGESEMSLGDVPSGCGECRRRLVCRTRHSRRQVESEGA
jgi:hypothetical protein